jgi:microsomal prostaglandin-E synthase 2
MSTSNPTIITLYQFQLCPYCHKIRAALDLKGVTYNQVEVSPGKKKELPPLPEDAPKKVPVLQVGERIVWDSTDILLEIDRLVPDGIQLNDPSNESRDQEIKEVEDWIDDHLIPALPTVIYATWTDAIKAAQLTARESQFSWWEGFKVRVFGSIIMKMIAKRILKRHQKTNGHQWMTECVDVLETRLQSTPYLIGQQISIADAAFHGALMCVYEFPIFKEIMKRPVIETWFNRIQSQRS